MYFVVDFALFVCIILSSFAMLILNIVKYIVLFSIFSGTPVASATTSQPTGPAEPNSPMAAPPCSPPSDGSSQLFLEPLTHRT